MVGSGEIFNKNVRFLTMLTFKYVKKEHINSLKRTELYNSEKGRFKKTKISLTFVTVSLSVYIVCFYARGRSFRVTKAKLGRKGPKDFMLKNKRIFFGLWQNLSDHPQKLYKGRRENISIKNHSSYSILRVCQVSLYITNIGLDSGTHQSISP